MLKIGLQCRVIVALHVDHSARTNGSDCPAESLVVHHVQERVEPRRGYNLDWPQLCSFLQGILHQLEPTARLKTEILTILFMFLI